jgi:RNA binding exosome subunit
MKGRSMMEKQIDSLKRTIELTETCLEGIEHIKKRLNEGHFENAINLFSDIVEAYYLMERLIQSLAIQLPTNQLEERTISLRKAFEHSASAFEKNDWKKSQEIIQFTLLPAYKKWKSELGQALSVYTFS